MNECKQRRYDSSPIHDRSFVCVCASDYCDGIEPLGLEEGSTAVVYYTSSLAEERFKRRELAFDAERLPPEIFADNATTG